MVRLRIGGRRVLVSLLLTATFVAGMAIGPSTVGAVTNQVVNAFVTNTSANPVPVVGTGTGGAVAVSGSVSVSNLPATQNVSVSNLPATQTVSGTVTVGNSPTSAVPIFDAGVTQPVHAGCTAVFQSVPVNGAQASVDCYTVPTGKRLVILEASLEMDLPAGQYPVATSLNVNGVLALYFEPHILGSDTVGVNYAGAEYAGVYAAAGDDLSFFVQRSSDSGTGNASLLLNGYLISQP